MNTHAFFEYLARRAEVDTSVVATLRRSLMSDPGTFAEAFPLVEPFTQGVSERERRTVYLAAGLWASAQRRESGPALPLPSAMAKLRHDTGSASTEARFVALLDADEDELVWRLRHAINLTSSAGLALDWPALLQDLLRWTAPARFVQQQWARQFWQHSRADEPETQPSTGN